MFNFIEATKSQKVSQKTNTPSVPYIVIGKDGASATAIQFFPKGGARDLLQGTKEEQYVSFAFCKESSTFAVKLLKDKKTADTLKSKGLQIRLLTKDKNLAGGYGCSSLKRSIKNEQGLDFTDMATKYIGTLEKSDTKDTNGFHFIAKMEKE